MDEFRMLSSDVVEDNEEIIEQSLRPQALKEYIGQTKVTNELQIYIK